jgi:hypothetical protein
VEQILSLPKYFETQAKEKKANKIINYLPQSGLLFSNRAQPAATRRRAKIMGGVGFFIC